MPVPRMQSRYSEFAFLPVSGPEAAYGRVPGYARIHRATSESLNRTECAAVSPVRRRGRRRCPRQRRGSRLPEALSALSTQFECSHHTVQITLHPPHGEMKHSRLYTYLEIHKSHGKIRHGLFSPPLPPCQGRTVQ